MSFTIETGISVRHISLGVILEITKVSPNTVYMKVLDNSDVKGLKVGAKEKTGLSLFYSRYEKI